uniref:hypothetical protein n=1 Tax=Klebsiella pneumoniae TaxID=573 RepID=UPI001C8F655B
MLSKNAHQNKSGQKKPYNTYHQPLTIFHQNIRKLPNKRERLNHLLQELSPTIVVLTEHGLNEDDIKN